MTPATPRPRSFERALEKFKANLTSEQLESIAICTLTDVHNEVKRIQQIDGPRRELVNFGRIGPFLEGMEHLSKSIEVYLNLHAIVCFIWGPIKLMLGIAQVYQSTLSTLLGTYETIGREMPGLLLYQDVFEKYPALSLVLEDLFGDILEFHCLVFDFLNRSKRRRFLNSIWKTFDSNFGPILSSLQSHRQLLDSNKGSVTIAELDRMRGDIQVIRQNSERQVRDVDNDRHETLINRIRDRLQVPNYELEREMLVEEASIGSGTWLFNHPDFVKWVDTGTQGHITLYINGVPGGGKSTLITKALTQLIKKRTTRQQSGAYFPVLYFYCRYNQQNKRTFNSILRGIFFQLLAQDQTLTKHICDEISIVDSVELRSSTWLLASIEKALLAYDFSYIVIDGLGECQDGEAKKSLDWILSITSGNIQQNGSSIRAIISGQRSGELYYRVSRNPSISLDSSGHLEDVGNYCRSMATEFKTKFELDDMEIDSILNKVGQHAQGLFLYAKLVLNNLLRQTKLYRLRQELQDGVFPDGIQRAYDRVFQTVFGDSISDEAQDAATILRWVAVSKRLLHWREIQATFCIDTMASNADYKERRLRVSCKRLCGSFVDFRPGTGPAGSEAVIHLVHQSAKEGTIQLEAEVARMSIFCCQYLTTTPFQSDITHADITHYAQSGYYALQDYCVAYWFDHIKEFLKNSNEVKEDVRQTVSESMTKFLNFYYHPSTLEDAVKEKITKCPFKTVQTLPEDARKRNELLDIECRTVRIRNCIEAIVESSDIPHRAEAISNLHGTERPFKCPKSWCDHFSSTGGFEDRTLRDSHVDSHELPFRCSVDSCFAFTIGFNQRDKLTHHLRSYHGQNDDSEPSFLIPPKSRGGDLFTEVEKGDVDMVQYLLDHGANPNSRRRKRNSLRPLDIACKYDHVAICKLLIRNGATLERGLPPLHIAIEAGNVDTVSFLLSVDGLSQMINFTGGQNVSPLLVATRLGYLNILQLLWTEAMKVLGDQFPEELASELLISACSNGHAGIVKFLLRSPLIDINAKYLDDTAFSRTAGLGHKQVVDLLLLDESVDVQSCHPIAKAIQNGHFNLAKSMLSSQGNRLSKDHAISISEALCGVDCVDMLRQTLSLTKLDVNCNNGSLLRKAMTFGNLAVVEILLAHRYIDISSWALSNNPLLFVMRSSKWRSLLGQDTPRCVAVLRKFIRVNSSTVGSIHLAKSDVVQIIQCAFICNDNEIMESVTQTVADSQLEHLWAVGALRKKNIELFRQSFSKHYQHFSNDNWGDIFQELKQHKSGTSITQILWTASENFILMGKGLFLFNQARLFSCEELFNGIPADVLQGSASEVQKAVMKDVAAISILYHSPCVPLISFVEWFLREGLGTTLLWVCLLDRWQKNLSNFHNILLKQLIADSRVDLNQAISSLPEAARALLPHVDQPFVTMSPLRYSFRHEKQTANSYSLYFLDMISSLLVETERVPFEPEILFEAVKMGDERFLDMVLSSRLIDLNRIQDVAGQTALEKASALGSETIVERLLATGICNADSKQAALSIAEERGHHIIISVLSEY